MPVNSNLQILANHLNEKPFSSDTLLQKESTLLLSVFEQTFDVWLYRISFRAVAEGPVRSCRWTLSVSNGPAAIAGFSERAQPQSMCRILIEKSLDLESMKLSAPVVTR